MESIRKNSTLNHQIIVHVNEGADETIAWLEMQKIDYTHSIKNVGICFAMNSAFSLARAEYIAYMNDDMYACPGWDQHLFDRIKSFGSDNFFYSSTMIEPTGEGNPAVIAPHNFGRTPDEFQEDRLLEQFSGFQKENWSGASWPPNVMHRRLWEQIGGYSIEFSPGMYSDPDLAMKLWKAGVREFAGIGKSRVYHFQSVTTSRIVKNNGRKQFLMKWGITPSNFNKNLLRLGEPYQGKTSDNLPKPGIKERIKKWF